MVYRLLKAVKAKFFRGGIKKANGTNQVTDLKQNFLGLLKKKRWVLADENTFGPLRRANKHQFRC